VIYRGRHEEFKDFFSLEDRVVFCNDVFFSVMEVLGLEYNPNQWPLFTGSSGVSLKMVEAPRSMFGKTNKPRLLYNWIITFDQVRRYCKFVPHTAEQLCFVNRM